MVIVLVAGGVYYWGGNKATPESGTPADTTAGQTTTGGEQGVEQEVGVQIGATVTSGNAGKMTDEVYIELMAASSVYAADPQTYASRIKALYVKYDVTEENVQAYAEEMNKDPQRATSVGQRYIKRAMELRSGVK